jgi:hypothetical protein
VIFPKVLIIKLFQNYQKNLRQILRLLVCKNPIFRHIKSNNSGTAKVKIIKNERDPPLFTGKLLIKFQKYDGK